MAELTPAQYDAAIEQRYPWVKWREPIPISTPRKAGFGCRLCMARMGFKATEAREKLFDTKEEFMQHLWEVHSGV
jgi:hypothetical protein